MRNVNAPTASLDALCVNVVRGLAIDAVQQANSGHPGMPLGAAPMAHALWTRHLRHDPRRPRWFGRDRFVLSAGHGSMLLYALLHLTGYDLSLDELRRFRQWGSKTPGHPENHLTPGVEMATGPLGQGFSTAVGMAIAERHLAAVYNRPGHRVVDHRTFVLCSDGDLMEGVANEAASLAGHLRLGKLIALYDDNQVTIDGGTDLAFTEDVDGRFRALGWRVIGVDSGMDVEAVDAALTEATSVAEQPTLIRCRTTIGYGSPNKAGSAKSHGAALGAEEVLLTKKALGLPEEPFWIAEEVLAFYRTAVTRGAELSQGWEDRLKAYEASYPDLGAALRSAIEGDDRVAWDQVLPRIEEAMATRKASEKVIQAVAAAIPGLVGGCADLADSVMTHIHGSGLFQAERPTGRNVAYGVREHAMMAAVNGMTLHGGLRAFGGTFLVFSDYCRPSIRLAALMQCPSIFVFSHDSIGLGEDGPTHQPIEHLASLRAIPNLNVMRPADGAETAACWRIALESRTTPSVIVLTRQSVPICTPSLAEGHPSMRGAYVLREASGGAPRAVIVATGSEVGLALAAAERLEREGIATRVVSMPSWFLFERQDAEYRRGVFPDGVPVVSVEAASSFGWARYAQAHVAIDRFGASAPAEVLFREFGFTPEHVAETVRSLL
jgi:transketolase